MSYPALHNPPPRPQALKEEIRNENQDKRKIFDPGGIRTHDLRIRTSLLNQLSYEARPCLNLYYHRKHVKGTINHQLLPGRNIFWSPRAQRTTAGLMHPAAFLVTPPSGWGLVIPFFFPWFIFWWSLAPVLRFSLGQRNTRRVFRYTAKDFYLE